MRRARFAILAILLVALAAVLGCPQRDGDQDQQRQRQRQTAELRIVNEQNEVLESFTLQELRDMDEETATVQTPEGTETLSGPTLKTVLDQANVPEAQRFAVIGTTGSTTVTAEETQTGILDITDSSVRFASPDLPREQWVRNVNQIVVSGQTALTVTRDGDAVEAYTFDELQGLLDTTATVGEGEDRRTVTGARLSTVLEDAGVGDAQRVRVVGEERNVTVEDQQIQNSALFIDERNRNTIGFASLDVPRNRWPSNVQRVEVLE